jgi:predicted nucleic acid-binding protein
MMNDGFVDTSGWLSLFLKTEPHHTKASNLVKQWHQKNRRVITTNYVLSELIALFSRFRVKRSVVLNYIENIRSATWVEIVHINEALDLEAWEMLANRVDKEWSLVDCASFVVMENYGLTEALATDKHFEQAGFTRLLK